MLITAGNIGIVYEALLSERKSTLHFKFSIGVVDFRGLKQCLWMNWSVLLNTVTLITLPRKQVHSAVIKDFGLPLKFYVHDN